MSYTLATTTLSILDSRDVPKIASHLEESLNEDTCFDNFLMRGILLDGEQATFLSNALTANGRLWNNFDIHHCGGSCYQVLTTAIKSDAVIQMRLVNVDSGDNGLALLGDALEGNTSLTHLRLTTSILDGSNISEFANGLRNNTTLRSIDFKYSVFGDKGCHALARGLSWNNHIRDVSFNGCNLTDGHARILLQAFQKEHPSLESLDLNSNFCGRGTSEALAAILESPDCKLKSLDIGCQRLDGSFDTKILCTALARNQSLQILDVSNMSLCDRDAKHLADALILNKSLKELYFSRNKVTIEGISYIAQRLPGMTGLKKLSLWGNALSDEAANKLLDGLKDNYYLEYLELFQEFKSSRAIKRLTLLNRGGRRIFQSFPNTIPTGLWPHLLERINKKQMAKRMRRWSDSDEPAKREAIFYFLQTPALLNR